MHAGHDSVAATMPLSCAQPRTIRSQISRASGPTAALVSTHTTRTRAASLQVSQVSQVSGGDAARGAHGRSLAATALSQEGVLHVVADPTEVGGVQRNRYTAVERLSAHAAVREVPAIGAQLHERRVLQTCEGAAVNGNAATVCVVRVSASRLPIDMPPPASIAINGPC